VLQEAYIFDPTVSDFEKKKKKRKCVRFIFQRLDFAFLLERGREKKT